MRYLLLILYGFVISVIMHFAYVGFRENHAGIALMCLTACGILGWMIYYEIVNLSRRK